MILAELGLIDLNADYTENQDIFIHVDNDELYSTDSSDIYNTSYYFDQEEHFRIINNTQNKFAYSTSISSNNISSNQISVSSDVASLSPRIPEITTEPVNFETKSSSVSEIPSFAGASGSNAFLITEEWGHKYVTAQSSEGYYFGDVEKHDGTAAGDDLLCWAATASNVLQWGGWANNISGETFSTEQNVLDYFAAHWTDEGGFTQVGWEWWMNGEEPGWYVENYEDASHVDVAGAGFFPTVTIDSVIDEGVRNDGVNFKFETYWDFLVEHFEGGYGVGLGISSNESSLGHAITAWGYEETDGVKYLYYSDSDDDRNKDGGGEAAPDALKRTRMVLNTDAYSNVPNGIYQMLDYEYPYNVLLDQVVAFKQYDSDMSGVAETFDDARVISVSDNVGSRRGNIDVNGDKDFYSVTLEAGYVVVRVDALTVSNVQSFSLYSAVDTDTVISTGSLKYGFMADAGEYYIVVEGLVRTAVEATDNTYVVNLKKDLVAPDSPSGMTSNLPGLGDDVVLDWNNAVDIDSNIKEYEVQIASDYSFTEDIQTDIVTDSTTNFNDLSDGTYFWRVRAEDAAGNLGEWSGKKTFVVDILPPTVPSNLSAEDNLSGVSGLDTFTWTASTDLGSGVKEYIFEYSENSDYANSVEITVDDTEILISALPGMLTYYWRVKAVDDFDRESAWSEWESTYVEDTVAPLAPERLSRDSDSLLWNVSDDVGSGVKKYILEYSEDADDWSSATEIESDTNSTLISNLILGERNYYWRVKAVDKADNESEYSEIQTFTETTSDNETMLNSLDSYLYYGNSVSISDNNIAVGIDVDDVSSKVYVYRWDEAAGSYYEYVLDRSASDNVVLMSGDNVVVGSKDDDTKGTDAGAASIYRWDEETYSYNKHKFTASDGANYDIFGSSIASDGESIVIGANKNDDNGSNSGSAYVYHWDEKTSSYTEYKITASNGLANDAFGSSVAVYDDKVFVGAYKNDDGGEDSGSIYFYTWDASNSRYLETMCSVTPSDSAAGDKFGYSMSNDGYSVVVGAIGDDNATGSAYVYRWNEETSLYTEYKLTASDGSYDDNFGYSVSISGDYVAVGAVNDDDVGNDSGSVYLYQWFGEGYEEISKIIASNGAAGDNFGYSISISGEDLIVGTKTGSAGTYIYSLDPEGNDENPVLEVNADDEVGPSVVNGLSHYIDWRRTELSWNDAIDNKINDIDYVVQYTNTGSFADATEVEVSTNELETDNLDGDSTYLWRVKARDESDNVSAEWSEEGTFDTFASLTETRMTAKGSVAGDNFGSAVAVSGENRVVGAYGEDNDTGDAYAYRWNGERYIEYKLSDYTSELEEGDRFGSAVSVSGDTVVVGAYKADNYTGGAYIYRWNGDDYEVTELVASDISAADCFASSVSISDDNIAIKSGYANKAYVYRWDDGEYVEYSLALDDAPAQAAQAGLDSGVDSGSGQIETNDLTTSLPVFNEIVGSIPDELSGTYTATEVPTENPNKFMSLTNDAVILAGETLTITIAEGFTAGTDIGLSFDDTDLTFTISGTLITDIFPDDNVYGVAFNGDTGEFNMTAGSNFDAIYDGEYERGTYGAVFTDNELTSDGIGGDITVVADTDTVFGIQAENIDFSGGDISGNISVTTDYAYSGLENDLRYVYGMHSHNLTAGEISGSVMVSGNITNETTFYAAPDVYAIKAYELTIGEISGTVSATSSVAGASDTAYSNSFGIYTSTGNLDLGNISGTVSSTSSTSGTIITGYSTSYAINAFTGNLSLKDISGTVSATSSTVASIGDAVSHSYALYAREGDMLLENISGTVSSTSSAVGTNGGSNSYSYALYNLSGDITLEEISGTVSASSTVESGEAIVDAIYTGGDLFIDEISGSITAIATATDSAYWTKVTALQGEVISGIGGAALVITEDATITAVGNSNSTSYVNTIFAYNGMNLDISGTISASSSEPGARSLYSYSNVTDTIVLRSTADITGDIVLSGGADTLSFKSGNSDFTAVNVAGDISGDDLTVDFDITGFSDGSTILTTDSDGFGSTFSLSMDFAAQEAGEYILIDSSLSGFDAYYDGETFTINGTEDLVVNGENLVVGARAMHLSTVGDNQIVLTVAEVVIDSGNNIDISGDYVVAGDRSDNAAYVYSWDSDDYELIEKLSASDEAADDKFAYSAAILDSTVVVGAINDDDKGTDSGSAYVYRWNEGSSSYDEYKLTALDGAANDNFGYAVEISDKYVMVGAIGNDDNGADSGSVYFYEWDGDSYNQIKKLVASNGAAGDKFGISLSASGDNLLVGTESGNNSSYFYDLDEVVPPTTPGVLTGMTVSVPAAANDASLSWNDQYLVTEFDIQVDDNSDFSSPDFENFSKTNSYLLSDMSDGIYYWRVMAYNEEVTGAWTEGQSFTIDTSIETPEDISAKSYVIFEHDMNFSWSSADDLSGIKEYEYSLDDDSDFSSTIANERITETSLAVSDLALGTYYWKVRAHDNSGNISDWSETKSFNVIPENNSFNSAMPIDVSSPYTNDDNVGVDDTVDFYKITVDNAGKFDFALTGLSNKVSLNLYNSSYKKQKWTVSKGTSTAINNVLLDTGEYYIQVASGNNATTNIDYDLSVIADYFPEPSVDEFEFKYGIGTPASMVLDGDADTSASGWVGFGDAQDVFKFTVETAGKFDFALEGLSSKALFNLYSEYSHLGMTKYKKQKGAKSRGTNVAINDILLTAGDYYIEVISGDKGKGKYNTDYDLNINGNYFPECSVDEYEFKYGIGTPCSVVLDDDADASVSDWVGLSDAQDVFKFTVDKAGEFDFALTDLSSKASFNLYYEYDHRGVTKYKKKKGASARYNKITGKTSAAFDNILLGAGDYYIEVVSGDKGKGKQNTDYDLNINGDYFPEATVDEFNFKIGVGTPDSISFEESNNASASGWVGFGDAQDVFKFTVDNASEFDFALTDLNSKTSFSLYREYDYKGTTRYKKVKGTKSRYNKNTGETSAVFNDISLSIGDYYVEVLSGDKGKGKYNTDYDLNINSLVPQNLSVFEATPDGGSFSSGIGNDEDKSLLAGVV
jgi:FG-GAP repeat protein